MNAPQNAAPSPPSPIRAALFSQRRIFLQVGWLSLVTGVLALAPSWFMFEVYGRVLDSRNTSTLFWLLLMVLGVYLMIELLDLVRVRALAAAGEKVETQLRGRLFNAAFDAQLRRQPGGTTQVFVDIKTLREFISGQAVRAVLDTPAAVLCLVLLFMLSPWLGLLAALGALMQVGLAVLTERRTMPLLTEAIQSSMQAQSYAASTLRNGQVIESMGMLGHIHQRWARMQRRFISKQAEASDYAGINATAAKLVQQMQSSILLGAAALLLLDNDLFGGGAMLIVASILGTRVLSPLAQIVGQWRNVVTVRDAVKRLEVLLSRATERQPGMPLPAPKGVLTVENVTAGAPGAGVAIIRGVAFGVRPGEVLAVIGPSASGKTTLARLLVGIWPAVAGKVRLDGADVFAWNKAELGPHLGYLPQSVELFDGTVAENIARFGDVDLERVRAATDRVGITEMIEALPQGFDTRIGEEGAVLSGGQRQRLGLARAVYGDPQLIVLDEPNASLDEAGDKALLQLLGALKSRGATVIVITHRTTMMPAIDKLLVLADGQMKFFGPRDEVIAALKKANEQVRAQAGTRQLAAARAPGMPGGNAA